MTEVRMRVAYSGKLGDVWNPRAGQVIETTDDNARLLVRHGVAALVGEDVETRTEPAAEEPKPAKKKATRRRKGS